MKVNKNSYNYNNMKYAHIIYITNDSKQYIKTNVYLCYEGSIYIQSQNSYFIESQ